MSNNYTPISCANHSVFELAIMRQQQLKVSIDQSVQTITPKDMFTKSGEEFIVFIDENNIQQELRADKITLQGDFNNF